MKWNDQMRTDLLALYADKLRSMSEEDFWDQFDELAIESHGKIEADHYQARLTIAYNELGKQGIKTEESGLGVLASMIEAVERCGIQVVKAKSVEDYLDRYYRKERRSDTTLDTYEEEYIREGYVHTSHFDNITGSHIYWPKLPDGFWESMPEVKKHRNLVDTIVGNPIVIVGQIEQWENVQAIQDQSFIYIMANGSKWAGDDLDTIENLLGVLSHEPLDVDRFGDTPRP